MTSTPFLPVFIGLLFWSTMRVNLLLHTAENPNQVKSNPYAKFTQYFANGMNLFMVGLSTQVPCGIALYWTGSALTGLATTLFLVSPKAKNLFRIKKFPDDSDKPYQTIYNNAKAKYLTKYKTMSKKLSKYKK